jgi:hypothetical protein
MGSRARETVPKCAPGDMPGPGSLSGWHPIPDRHDGVMQLRFGIHIHDHWIDVWKKFGDQKKNLS